MSPPVFGFVRKVFTVMWSLSWALEFFAVRGPCRRFKAVVVEGCPWLDLSCLVRMCRMRLAKRLVFPNSV